MDTKADITERLAARLREERKAKGLSLDALSRLSGVSRSMLSQIERGGSSPTVASLWNLTRALNLDFSRLLDQEAAPVASIREVITSENIPVIRNRAAGCEVRILSAPEDVGQTEVYDILFQPGAALESAPHSPGCEESLTVLEGHLTVESNSEMTDLSTGDTARYAADVEHAIRAKDRARALLLVRGA